VFKPDPYHYDAFGILTKKIFDLVITDVRMPGLTGLDILPRIMKIQPEVATTMITAFGTEEIRRKDLREGRMPIWESNPFP
jgi:YesN/AraC family two-component response regulator